MTARNYYWALPDRPIFLASTSPTRRKMMEDAGLRFDAIAAPIDEEAIRIAGTAEGLSAIDIAILLAEMKAARLAMQKPEGLVIGCDQILLCEEELFAKPADIENAHSQLQRLAGKDHILVTAAVIFDKGQRIWHHCAMPKLRIRPLSDAEITVYLDALGPAALASPGSYQIEGLGAQILQKIDGDPYSILGMPLLEILQFLREHGLGYMPEEDGR